MGQLIPITSISLDTANFRHHPTDNEREAIRSLLSVEKKHGILDLAKDIVELGELDPSSLLIVQTDPDNENQYIVLEGNRRITALKTLINPDLASGLDSHAAFKRLSPAFLNLNLSEVECVVLSADRARIWIRRKHYNAMGGRGVLKWDAVATARSDAAEGVLTRWMALLNFLESNDIDISETMTGIERKTTTVERVLTSRYMKEGLGVVFAKDGQVAISEADIDKAVVLFLALLGAMSESKFKETDVSTKDQQTAFLKQFDALSLLPQKENPDEEETSTDTGNGTTGGETTSDEKTEQQDQGGTEAKGAEAAADTTKSHPIKVRNKLAKVGLPISNTNLNKFYYELKKLPVEPYRHCAAATLRIFLEKSTVVFLESTNVSLPPMPGVKSWTDSNIKLREKVKAALTAIDPKKKDDELKYVRDIANGQTDRLHTLDELNGYIHHHKPLPTPSELIEIWDRYHPYFKSIFAAIEANRK